MNDKWLYSYLNSGDGPEDLEFGVDTDWDEVDQFVMDQIKLGRKLEDFTGVNDKVGLKESRNLTEHDRISMEHFEFYRDIYGYKPRIDYSKLSVGQIKDMILELEDTQKEEGDWIERESKINKESLEKAIDKYIDAGAGDRPTALRWLFKDQVSAREMNINDISNIISIHYNIYDNRVLTSLALEVLEALSGESGVGEYVAPRLPSDEYDEMTDRLTPRFESIGRKNMKTSKEEKTVALPGHQILSESDLLESEKYNCFESLLPEGFGFKDEEWSVMTESEKEDFLKYHLAEDIIEEVEGEIITEADLFDAELSNLDGMADAMVDSDDELDLGDEGDDEDVAESGATDATEEDELDLSDEESEQEDVFERLIKDCGYHEDEWDEYL